MLLSSQSTNPARDIPSVPRQVVPAAHRGKKELIALEKTGLGTSFTLHRRKYIYEPMDETFHKVGQTFQRTRPTLTPNPDLDLHHEPVSVVELI